MSYSTSAMSSSIHSNGQQSKQQLIGSRPQQFDQFAQQYQQITSMQFQELKKIENKYKTELCKNWVSRQECHYGSKCRFAHGKHELIERLAQNKGYKTKLCSAFHQEGACLYAARCHFRHDERNLQDILAGQIHRRRLALLSLSECNDENINNLANNIHSFEIKNQQESTLCKEDIEVELEKEVSRFKIQQKVFLKRLPVFETITSDEENYSTTAGSDLADDASFSSGFLRMESPELTPQQIPINCNYSNILNNSNNCLTNDPFNFPPLILDQEISLPSSAQESQFLASSISLLGI